MSFRLALPALLFAFLISGGGCSYLGYQKYRPTEINEYDDMLADMLDGAGAGKWMWVRGKVEGDIDGDGRDEEVVLATIQEGDTNHPGKVQKAVLLICKHDDKGGLKLLLRRNIFDDVRSLRDASFPAEVWCELPPEVLITHASAKIVDVDSNGRGLILVSLWGRDVESRAPAWHGGYRYVKAGEGVHDLDSVLCTLAMQREPSVETVDLNKDGRDELLLNQQVLGKGERPLSLEISAPEWLTVFSVGKDGKYVISNRDFGGAYSGLLLPWYRAYAHRLQDGTDKEILARYQYYLGLVNTYRRNKKTASEFFAFARNNASDGSFANLVRKMSGSPGDKKP